MSRRGTALPVGAMLGATLLWGATFVVIRDALHRVDPVSLVFTRFLAAAALLGVALVVARRRPDREAVRGGVLIGILSACGFLFQAIGLRHTSAGTSAFLTSLGSLFAGVFAWPLLGQRPGALLASGIALAVAGSFLLASPAAFGVGPGEGWTLLGAVAWGLQVVAIARFAPHADPLALTAVQAATVAAAMLPFAIGRDPLAGLGDPALLARVGYLVVAGSVIAPFLQVVAQRRLSAGRVGLLLALEPVFALLFALTLGAERFAPRWWAGAGLIVLAIALVEWRAGRAEPPARP